MSTGWILLALLLGAGVVFVGFFIVRGFGSASPGALQLIEATASAERVARLGLPTRGSENQRHLLQKPAGAAPAPTSLSTDSSSVVFRLQVTAPKGQPFELKKVRSLLTAAWYGSSRHPTVKVTGKEPGRWAYLYRSKAPATFEEILFEWELADMLAEDIPPLTAEFMESYVVEVQRLFGLDVEYQFSPSIGEAAKRAAELRRLLEDCDREALIVLQATEGEPFEGRIIWDVMHSLGLGWGDFDLFHWTHETKVGSDYLFSVSTSTEPGYFLPEKIIGNELVVADLVFSFTIPKTDHASTIFEVMLAAAEYSKNRLGGRLVDEQGKAFDSQEARTEIARIEKRLADAGLAGPGAPFVPFGSHNVRASMFMSFRAMAQQMVAPRK